MKELQIFKNEQFGEIRTIEANGKVLFCGSDVAKALGYSIPSKAVNTHCKGASKMEVPTNGGIQQMLFIPEGDLYRLITHSKLPSAEQFESWVFDEVLPTIRKTGGYVANDEAFINTYLPHADEQTVLMFKSQLQVIKNLNQRIEQDKPKVLFADAVTASHSSILVGELAKILRQNGIDTGGTRLFKWMRDNGYLIKRRGTDWNMPTQRSMDMGLFEIKESVHLDSNGCNVTTKTAKVTGIGQKYFINKFLGRAS